MVVCPFGITTGLSYSSTAFKRAGACVGGACGWWDDDNNCCVVYSFCKGKGKEAVAEPKTPEEIEEVYLAKKGKRVKQGE